MPKPEWVTWGDIKKCLIRAHEANQKKGFMMQRQFMSDEDFEENNKDSYCFVALKDKDVVGTMSFRIRKCKQWWAKGQNVIYNCGDAVIPEYKGTDVYLELHALRAQHIKKTGIRIIQSDTAEDNQLLMKLFMRSGAKKVRLITYPSTWYYSVVMVRWLDGSPYSDRYCKFRFKLSSLLCKLFYKPGRKFRFLP